MQHHDYSNTLTLLHHHAEKKVIVKKSKRDLSFNVQILDEKGRYISSYSCPEEIDVSKFPIGHYQIIWTINNNETVAQKLLIKH